MLPFAVVDPLVPFAAALGTTAALLGCAAVAGRRRKIGGHILFVWAAVVMLALSIKFALDLGKAYDLESAGRITPIHLTIARITTISYLWPLLTGPLAMRDKVPRKLHRVGAWCALLLTLAALVTGAMMVMGAERIVPPR